jgi:hypothetical protein
MRKIPRLYIALKSGLRLAEPHSGVITIVKNEEIFSMNPEDIDYGEKCIDLPYLAPHEKCSLRISRSPNGVLVRMIKENVRRGLIDATNLCYTSDVSFEFLPGFILVSEEKIPNSNTAVLRFSNTQNPGNDIFLNKELVKAIYDMPNDTWIWTAESGLMEKNPTTPHLFIYLRENCRVITPTSGDELWILEKYNGEQLITMKFSKKIVDMYDRHFIALPRGYRWAGWEWADRNNSATPYSFFAHFQNLSCVNTPERPSFAIPEKYIARVYDMTKREYIYQHVLPNPPQ